MLENIMENTKIERIMKHGWHQKVNNVVCYYQTPFEVSLI